MKTIDTLSLSAGVEMRGDSGDDVARRHAVHREHDLVGVQLARRRPLPPDPLDRRAAVHQHAVEVRQDGGEPPTADVAAAARWPAASAWAARPPSSVTASPKTHSVASAADRDTASANTPISGGPTMKPV